MTVLKIPKPLSYLEKAVALSDDFFQGHFSSVPRVSLEPTKPVFKRPEIDYGGRVKEEGNGPIDL